MANRRGATLPAAIIVLAVMAVAVAITYGRISAERVISTDAKAQQAAFAVAQSGLSRFFANLNGKSPSAGPRPITANYPDLPGGTTQHVK